MCHSVPGNPDKTDFNIPQAQGVAGILMQHQESTLHMQQTEIGLLLLFCTCDVAELLQDVRLAIIHDVLSARMPVQIEMCRHKARDSKIRPTRDRNVAKPASERLPQLESNTWGVDLCACSSELPVGEVFSQR